MLSPNFLRGEHIVAASSVRPCTIFVRAVSQQLMTGIQLNIMGSFTTKRRHAYYQPVLVGWFFTELQCMALWNFPLTVHKVQFLSGLFLSNQWLAFNKIYGKLHYQEDMCILSAGSRRMIFHRVMALWNFTLNI